MWIQYRDVVVSKLTPAEGRKHVSINIGHIFHGLNYDWTSGKSYAQQVREEAERGAELKDFGTTAGRAKTESPKSKAAEQYRRW